MDVTASTITVISSVWTLTIQCKKLVEGIKSSNDRITELVRKAESFATVIGQIDNAYSSEPAGDDEQAIGPDENGVREDIQKHIQKELSRCEEDFRRYEKEVSRLSRQSKAGKVGIISNTWREKVANPTIERLEKSIADHQSCLQTLMEVHRGHTLEETRKDQKQLLIAINQLFEKMEDLSRAQGLPGQDEPTTSRSGYMRRRTDSNLSDITLVSPHEDIDGETEANIESENSNALHAFAQEIFIGLLKQMAPSKGSISLPGQFQGLSNPGATSEVRGYQDSKFSTPQYTPTEYRNAQIRRPSFPRKRQSDTASPLSQVYTRRSDVSSDDTSLSGSLQNSKRSISETSRSSIVPQTDDGDVLIEEEAPLKLPKKNFMARTDRQKGMELLEAIKKDNKDMFTKLVDSNASLEEKDEKGKTPLILATSLGELEMVEHLVTRGANVQAVDNDQATALHIAARKLGNKQSFRSITSLLANPRNSGHAVSISNGNHIDINSSDKSGRTPLHNCTYSACAEDDMEEVARELITCQADVNAKDKAGRCPMYYAIDNRRFSVVKLLLKTGADVDFERPDTSLEIGRLLDNYRDYLNGKRPSPLLDSPKPRQNSSQSPKERRGSRFSFSRRSSGSK